jgi:SAM-dependent methyltransferase
LGNIWQRVENVTTTMTWEEAVLWLRSQEDRQDLVRSCYYDDPLEEAAERFYLSEEWQATRGLLGNYLPGKVLEIGAGRGIASYAFAKEGCSVTALEPDPSAVVGRGAIAHLSARIGLDIKAVGAWGESLPWEDNYFDVVYGRAVLHHARHLATLCKEVARIVRPGGVVLWVREHVISRPGDLQAFLASHPLHALYGGEKAYTLAEYQASITEAGLHLAQVLGPLENPVNFFPRTRAQVDQVVLSNLAKKISGPLARLFLALPACRPWLTRYVSHRLENPGRHYAFLGTKP